METEQLIKELRIKNDVLFLTEEELIEKYGENKEKAEYFMHMFSRVFVNHAFFPTMIYDQYDKVKNVLGNFNEKYTKDTEFEEVYKTIMNSFEREEKFAPTFETKNEYATQMYYLRTADLGIFDVHHPLIYHTFNKLVLNKTEELAEAYNVNPHFPNKFEYEAVMKKAEEIGLKGDQEKKKKIINNYKDQYPLIKVCYDPNMLIAINDILRNQQFDDKEELSLIALNLIDFSLSYKSNNKDFDLKGFKTVAKATSKIIKYNEKKKDKKDKMLSYKHHN